MDRFPRIFARHNQLAGARLPVTGSQLEAKLECSPATVMRAIRHLRGHLHTLLTCRQLLHGI